MKNIKFFVLTILVIFSILLNITPIYSEKLAPRAVNGVLDLKDWNFDIDGSIILDGEWEFYFDKLYTPNDFDKGLVENGQILRLPRYWNKVPNDRFPVNGFATYRLRVKSFNADEMMGIHMAVVQSAYRLWVDNELVAEKGVVSKDKENSRAYVRNSIEVFNPPSEEFDIVIQVSNYNDANSGLGQSLQFGLASNLKEDIEKDNSTNLFLVSFVITMAIYHLLLYMFRKKDKASLALALLSFTTGFAFFAVNNFGYILLPEHISFGPNSRLIAIVITFLPVAAISFVKYSYPEEMKSKYLDWIIKLTLVSFLVILVIPNNLIAIYLTYIQFYAGAIFLLWGAIMLKAIKNKRQGSKLIFIGMNALFFVAINDALFSQNIINTGFYTPVGMTILIFLHCVVLAQKFTNSFHAVETLSEKLISLDKLKDDFLANTSHELRTPVNGIIGLAESLIDGVAGELPEKAKYNLVMIASSGKRLSNLINDILDFSKLKNNDIVLQLKNVDMRQLVEIVITMSKVLISGKNIEINNNIPEDLPYALGDENRLQQIIYNLLGNAIKFTESGFVNVSAREIDGKIEVVVEDSGIGIPEEKIETIFQSFEQVDASISRNYGGTGLGLSITKHLVNLHDGEIWVESELQKGTKFFFTIPISDNESTYKSANINSEKIYSLDEMDEDFESISNNQSTEILFDIPESEIESLSKLYDSKKDNSETRILVVDDEKVNIQVLINQLSLENYSVTTASNGIEAINLFKNGHEFDLILLDIMMPKMSGYEVSKYLRQKYSLVELPILMLTAKNQIQDMVVGFDSGANDYLTKPFSKKELLARSKTLLTLKKSVQNAIENAQNFEVERRQRELSEKMKNISSSLVSSLDIDKLFEKLTASVSEIMDSDYSLIIFNDNEENNIVSVEDFKNNQKINDFSVLKRIESFIKKSSIFSNEITVVDLNEDNPDSEFKINESSKSQLRIPFIHSDSFLGGLVLESIKENAFSTQDLDLAATFANQVATAIQNATLFSKVKNMAIRDSLTGLYNRGHIMELANKSFDYAKRYNRMLHVMMMDIDYFKKINDTYGHSVGDKVLKKFSNILSSSLRTSDIIGRYGGEEFIVILPEIEGDSALHVAERLRKKTEETVIIVDDNKLQFTISIGIVSVSDKYSTFEAMLNKSDDLLYEAKENGRNQVKSDIIK